MNTGHGWNNEIGKGNEKSIPLLIHYCICITIRNRKRNKKFILMETKTHYCKDFDSYRIAVYLLPLHISISIPAYEAHPKRKIY